MFQQLLTIARNTFLESIRQPVFLVLLFIASLLLGVLGPQLAAYTMDDDNKMMIDMGLSTLLLAGLFMAAFTATGVVSEEVEKKTVLTVISKPVARPIFVLGKYLGVSTALGLAFWIMATVFLLAVRHKVMQTASDAFDLPVIFFGLGAWLVAMIIAAVGNYLYQWVFTSSFITTLAGTATLALLLVLMIDREWHFQSIAFEFTQEGAIGAALLIVMLLVFEAVLLLTAVAIAASTRLGQVMTLLICIAVFVLGLQSHTRLGPEAQQQVMDNATGVGSVVRLVLVKIGYWLVPNLQFLWLVDTLPRELNVPLSHVAWLTGYAALQITAVLCLAIALFQSREVG
ncbi:MAG: hypothetical protein WD042_10090 [Phycisphaeraceae bacterium]